MPPRRAAKHAAQDEAGLSGPTLFLLFGVFVALRTRYAVEAAVDDCDETFNYWEPLHQRLFGRGLQTWEYSPDFALRSWLYVLLHSIPGNFMLTLRITDGALIFTTLRCCLATAGSLIDTYLVSQASRKFGIPTAAFAYTFLLLSPGCVLSSYAFLPSSFAMMSLTLAAALQLEFYGTSLSPIGPHATHCATAVLCVLAAAILGWPFVGLIGIPIALNTLRANGLLPPLFWLLFGGLTMSGLVTFVDRMFYGVTVFSTWELVKYNVLGCLPRGDALSADTPLPLGGADGLLQSLGCVRDTTGQRGSHLYGVEPTSFFFVNLSLNFSVAFAAALASPLAVLLFARHDIPAKLWTLTPFLLWFAFWLFIPHKEERFMSPVYSLLCLNAALAFGEAWAWAGRALGSGAFRIVIRGGILLCVVAFVSLSAARLDATGEYYAKPVMGVMRKLPEIPKAAEKGGEGGPVGTTLCLGGDWYKFTSHFFVPQHVTVGFYDTGFEGLLPKYFGKNGTRSRPPGMNDLNRKDPAQFTPLQDCSYVVASGGDAKDLLKSNLWEIVHGTQVLDRAKTPPLARAFRLRPEVSALLPPALQAKIGQPVFEPFLLLKRKA